MLPNEKSNEDLGLGPVDDIGVFSQIVAAMKPLDKDARLRLFRLLTTYFDIPFSERGVRAADWIDTATTQSTAVSFSEDRSVSPKQFLFEKKPVTDIDRIACLAYYLTHYRQIAHFKTLDLSKLNTEAAQIKFSNPTVAVDSAAQAGILVQAGKGQKQLSAVGEVYVQALPDRIAAKEAISHARPRRSRSKSKQINKDSSSD